MTTIAVMKVLVPLVIGLTLLAFGLRRLMTARTKDHMSGASDQSDGTTLMLMTATGSTSKSPSSGHHDSGGHHGSDGGGFDAGGFDGGGVDGGAGGH